MLVSVNGAGRWLTAKQDGGKGRSSMVVVAVVVEGAGGGRHPMNLDDGDEGCKR